MSRAAIWIGLLLSTASLGGVLVMATAGRIQSGKNESRSMPRSEPVTVQASQEPGKDNAYPAGDMKPTADALAREPAREPLSALASPRSPAPPPEAGSLPKRWQLVHGAVATAAGVLDADGLTLVLPGIDVVSTDESCTGEGNRSWPCGMAARTAFRAYLRGRALNCRLPDARVETALLTECLLQGEDPARWLVQRGWARAKPDGPFAVEGELARANGQGIFGPPAN